ncbi:MAG TPA: C4-type zinc ribbon domain-containing protein [Polyangiaceae bacterium]|nr:C4-type zinc ribbon domain-containing protein [Polyangiaceae bacterium]
MKLQAQIEALENLAKLDASLAKLEAELLREGEVLSDKKQQLKRLEERFEMTRATVGDMDRTRNELMQDARQMSVQMERSREKLSRSRSEREVNAVQREIEELRKLYRDREQEIDKINGLAERARTEMDGASSERSALLGDLGANERELATRLGELEASVARERDQRKELVKAVPPVLYRRYELVRKRRGSAVAYTYGGTCSACHIAISPMMFQKLRRGEDFDQCPSCQRILYFRPEPLPEDQASDGSDSEALGSEHPA